MRQLYLGSGLDKNFTIFVSEITETCERGNVSSLICTTAITKRLISAIYCRKPLNVRLMPRLACLHY